MSNYNDALSDGQQTMTCPFDKAHTVTKFRFGLHVLKCKRDKPHIDLRVCIFNKLHYFPPNEIEDHQKICPSRSSVEQAAIAGIKRKSVIDDGAESEKKRSKAISRGSNSSSDDWDDDEGEPSNIETITIEERKRRVERDPSKIVHYQHTTKSVRDAKRRERLRLIEKEERDSS